MASTEEIRLTRLQKIAKLKERNQKPYPISAHQEMTNAEAIEKFEKLSERAKPITLVGRVLSMRPHGGLIFFTFDDGTAPFQGLLKRDEMEAADFDLFLEAVDGADFVEVTGSFFLTKRNEKTVAVKTWRMLSKALRQLPEKWHGLQDVEERYRHRYLDTVMSPEVKARFIMRSRIVSEIRRAFDDAGYIEVETPILQPIAGGASAKPFITHHNALDIDLYLRIAPELYLKELLVGGFPKVYEIGRLFRNEGIDVTHNPEFTTIEYYEAFMDAERYMQFTEKVLKSVIKKVTGKTAFTFDGTEIETSKEFARIPFMELFKRYAGITHPEKLDRDGAAKEAEKLGVAVEEGDTRAKIFDAIYKKHCRSRLVQPTFLTDYPVEFSPLAKRKENDPALIDRFQLVIGGLELVNAFSELNDPEDQRARFIEQEQNRVGGDEEAQPKDEEYLQAMEHGMPPAAGGAISIDRITMLLSDQKNIREVILFPTLRPKDAPKVGKVKEGKIAVAVVNKKAGLEPWQVLNTVAHLNAAFGARSGKKLFYQDEITTKDNQRIKLNIQHAIMIKEGSSVAELQKLSADAKAAGLEVDEFTREMIETTSDKKVIEATKQKDLSAVEHLGVLVFGSKSEVEKLTKELKLWS